MENNSIVLSNEEGAIALPTTSWDVAGCSRADSNNVCDYFNESTSDWETSTLLDDFSDDFEEELLLLIDDKIEYYSDEQPSFENFYQAIPCDSASDGGLTAEQLSDLKYCTARFSGVESMGALRDFLIEVNWYKWRGEITDADAIYDLKYLFRGEAQARWNRIRVPPTTWSEAMVLIKNMFEVIPKVQQLFAYYNFGVA